MNINLFVRTVWDDAGTSGSSILLHESDIRKLSLVGQVDVTCQSIPVGSMTIEVLTQDNLTNGKYIVFESGESECVCKWRIKSVKPIDDKYTQIIAEPCIAMFETMEMPEIMAQGSVNMGQIIGKVIPNNPMYGPIDDLSFTAYGYLPAQTGRERLIWLLFKDGQYLSCYGSEKPVGSDYTRTGESFFQRLPFETDATLIPYEMTFANASFSFRDRVGNILLTSYDFVESTALLLDSDDYRFPPPWTAITMELSSAGIINDIGGDNTEIAIDSNSDGDPEYKDIIIDNIYIVSMANNIEIMRRLIDYYMNPREMTVDVLNNFQYCAGDRVIVYAAKDKLVSGIIERANYDLGNYVRSTLKLVCVNDVPGAWLTMNYKVSGNIIGHDRRYLPTGKSYSITNPVLKRLRNGRIITYNPRHESTTGEMGTQDKSVDVTYIRQT